MKLQANVERPLDAAIRIVACFSKVLALVRIFAQASHSICNVSHKREFRSFRAAQKVFTAIGRFVANSSSQKDSMWKPWEAIKSRLAIKMMANLLPGGSQSRNNSYIPKPLMDIQSDVFHLAMERTNTIR